MLLLGILSIVFLIISLVIMLTIWPVDRTKTLSQHAARYKKSIQYYFVIFMIFLFFFSLFILNWFAPYYEMPIIFYYFYILGVIGQIVAVSVPETGGVKSRVHVIAASVMGISVFIQTVIITLLSDINSVSFSIGLSILVMMVALSVGVLFLRAKAARHALLVQSLFFGSYLFYILYVSLNW